MAGKARRTCPSAKTPSDGQVVDPHRALQPVENLAERLIGSIRRECLDHVLVLSEPHLRRILTAYLAYYRRVRTHLSLDKDPPDVSPVERPGGGLGSWRFPKSGAIVREGRPPAPRR